MRVYKYSATRINGDMLFRYMIRRHLPPQRLSDVSGVSLRTIYRALNGARVKIETLHKLAEALDVPVTLLVGDEDE